MSYLFTSESVSEGHPDKVADQISDALVDHFLAFDPDSKVACETLVTTGQVVLAGEVKSRTYIDAGEIARDVIRRIGYTKSEYMFEANSCGVFSAIHEQSPDINQGVDRASKEEQGAGDQGIMFGYATDETDTYMPLALELSHLLLRELAAIRKEGKVMKYLRPDAKSQVTVEYDGLKPVRVVTVVLSTQHAPEWNGPAGQKRLRAEVIKHIIKPVLGKRNWLGRTLNGGFYIHAQSRDLHSIIWLNECQGPVINPPSFSAPLPSSGPPERRPAAAR